MQDLKRKSRLGGAALRDETKSDAEQGIKFKTTLASENEGLADLLDRAAGIIAKSIFSSRLTSPEVHTVEEGLRVLFEDAAAFHRHQAATLSLGRGFLFDRKRA